MERRILKAPNLDDAHLGSRLVCHRPCRWGAPRMSIEHRGQQLIAHNYGHAGSGWSLAPGVVSHVNGLLIGAINSSSQTATKTTQDVPVLVLGAGVIGLFTAYNLLERGFQRVTIVADQFEGLTSHNAGGFIDSALYGESDDPDTKALINQCALDSYRFYIAISRGQKSDFLPEAAKQLPIYFDVGMTTGLELYIGQVLQAPKEVLVQFHDSPTHRACRRMVVFDDNIFLNVRLIMGTLRHFLEKRGVEFVQWRINSLDELKTHSVVVNCAGIGARELCHDKAVFPVQGHLIMLRNQETAVLDYMIMHKIGDGTTKSGHPVKRTLYMFPKRSITAEQEDGEDIGLIGGTFIPNCGPNTLNLEEFELMLHNARAWFKGEIEM